MNSNYIFNIDQLTTLTVGNQEDYVTGVMYSISLTEDSHTATYRNYKEFEVQQGESFTAFQELTPELVESWIKGSLTEQEIAFIDSRIQQELESQKNPEPTPQIKTAPWVKGNRSF